MIEYSYVNGMLRVKSTELPQPAREVRVTREYPDREETTLYRLGRRLGLQRSGGYYYAWYGAEIVSVSVDVTRQVREDVEQARADVDYIALMTGVEL